MKKMAKYLKLHYEHTQVLKERSDVNQMIVDIWADIKGKVTDFLQKRFGTQIDVQINHTSRYIQLYNLYGMDLYMVPNTVDTRQNTSTYSFCAKYSQDSNIELNLIVFSPYISEGIKKSIQSFLNSCIEEKGTELIEKISQFKKVQQKECMLELHKHRVYSAINTTIQLKIMALGIEDKDFRIIMNEHHVDITVGYGRIDQTTTLYPQSHQDVPVEHLEREKYNGTKYIERSVQVSYTSKKDQAYLFDRICHIVQGAFDEEVDE